MAEHSYGLLKGKTGIIFGPLDESSLGWHIATAAYREGAKLAISNVALALRIGKPQELAAMCGNAPLIPCDASNQAEIDTCFKEVKERFGKIDFIVHSVGMSTNIRKGMPYEKLNYDWYLKTIDVSGLSLHRLISGALENDVLNDYSSIIGLSHMAAQRPFTTYTDMAEAKAVLESIARNYGARLGLQKIRVNTVSQSPTWTRAGSGIEDFDKMYYYSDLLAPLGNASAEECGDYCVTLLSDLTRKVTMQNLYHDGGFALMGLSQSMLRLMDSVLDDVELMRKSGFSDEQIDRIQIRRTENK
ncbi:MAG TPA: enoyl-ACP reductase [Candidatus Kapabacteria bacterium]|nr:enoyl-ACP reductase [Candidatus Kapabacteria bacterium]